MAQKDYYHILGVTKSSSEEEIKKAYRKLAHQYHPDKASGNEARFKEINEAYQVLSNKEKRSQYDQYGQVFEGGGPQDSGWSGGFGNGGFQWNVNMGDGDFGDVFESIFEQFGGGRRRPTYTRGSDIEATEHMTLEEAFHGVKRTLQFRTAVKCTACTGLGHDKTAGFVSCTVCHGQGEIKEQKRTFFGNFSQVRSCPECHGRGQIPKKPCTACHGKGRIMGTRNVAVNIAPGIEDGQIIKIQNMGEEGEYGSGSGDLYVVVRVASHKVFTRKKNDLYMEHDLVVTNALLGKEVILYDIGGEKIHVKIPEGFNFKESLRVTGHGMPRFGALTGRVTRGDLYISFNLKLPKSISSKARKILEDFEKEV